MRESWQEVQREKTAVELGDTFYNDLWEEAPEVIHLFKRPRKMQVEVQTQNQNPRVINLFKRPRKMQVRVLMGLGLRDHEAAAGAGESTDWFRA